ncbi:Ig-like domain repeat protein [Candidatus Bathyarchaeota archaeon]|nr:Ig-like domain repeat protein [Candidatus Bathyarchaeota archaeon]
MKNSAQRANRKTALVLMFLLCTITISSILGLQIHQTSAEASKAGLTGKIVDQGVDINDNDLFESLVIGIEVDIIEAGEYSVEAYGLHASDFGYIGVSDYQSTFLYVGVQIVYLSLKGPTIHASLLSPASVSYISLRDNMYSVLGELYETPLSRTYLYTEFEAPGAVLTGVIYDRGIDVDGNGAYDFLEIGVEVNVTEAGNYIIQAGGLLTGDYGYISVVEVNVTEAEDYIVERPNGLLIGGYGYIGVSGSQSAHLNVGVQTVYLRFDGSTIYSSGLDPKNVSSISLLDEGYNILWELYGIPLSRTYLYTEFEAPIPITVGVKVGDWVKYTVIAEGQSTGPDVGELARALDMMKEIEGISVEVQSVSDTDITIFATYHFNNGTDMTLPSMSTDIAMQFLTYIIPSNLGEGDVIPGYQAIEETILRSYAGVSRNVNYVNYTVSFFGSSMMQISYWDKPTGFLCESLMETSFLADNHVTNISMLLEMTETNLWKIATELSCSVSKDTVKEGESMIVSGSVNATLSGKTVALTYSKPDGSTRNIDVTTGSDGSYSDSYAPDLTGSWSVTASWDGDSMYYGATSSSQSFTVTSKPFIETPLGMATVIVGITVVVIAVIVLVLRMRKGK